MRFFKKLIVYGLFFSFGVYGQQKEKSSYFFDFVKKNKFFIAPPACVGLFLFAYFIFKHYKKEGRSVVNNKVEEVSKDNEKEVRDNIFIVDNALREKFRSLEYNDFCESEYSTLSNNLSIPDKKLLDFTVLVYSSDKGNGLDYNLPSSRGKDQETINSEFISYRKFFILKGWLTCLPIMVEKLYKDMCKIKIPMSDKDFDKNTIESLFKDIEIFYLELDRKDQRLLLLPIADNDLFPFVYSDSMLYKNIKKKLDDLEDKYYSKYKDNSIVWFFDFKGYVYFEQFVKDIRDNNYYDNSEFENKVKNFDQRYQDFLLTVKEYQANNKKRIYLSQDDLDKIEEFKQQYDALKKDFDKINEVQKDIEWNWVNAKEPGIRKDIVLKAFPNYFRLCTYYKDFAQWIKDADNVFKKYDQKKFVLAHGRKNFYNQVELSVNLYKIRIEQFQQKKMEDSQVYNSFFVNSFKNAIGYLPEVFEDRFSVHKDFIKDVQTCARCKLLEGSSFMYPLIPHNKFICSTCFGLGNCAICSGSLSYQKKDGKTIIECDEVEEVKREEDVKKNNIIDVVYFIETTNGVFVCDEKFQTIFKIKS